MPLAAPIGRCEYGANSEDGHGHGPHHRGEVIAFGAGKQRIAIHKRHSMEVLTAPSGGHLGAIPRAVRMTAKSLSPNGIGAVKDLLEAGRIGW
jgi:hypothetical protein